MQWRSNFGNFRYNLKFLFIKGSGNSLSMDVSVSLQPAAHWMQDGVLSLQTEITLSSMHLIKIMLSKTFLNNNWCRDVTDFNTSLFTKSGTKEFDLLFFQQVNPCVDRLVNNLAKKCKSRKVSVVTILTIQPGLAAALKGPRTPVQVGVWAIHACAVIVRY